MTLEQYLKNRRKKLKYAQGDVARMLGLTSPQFISNLERLRCTWPVKDFLLLSEIFDTPVETMIKMRVEDVKREITSEIEKQKHIAAYKERYRKLTSLQRRIAECNTKK